MSLIFPGLRFAEILCNLNWTIVIWRVIITPGICELADAAFVSIALTFYRSSTNVCYWLISDFQWYYFCSAAEWKLDEPDWTGRLKVSAKGHNLRIRLEDKNTGIYFAVEITAWEMQLIGVCQLAHRLSFSSYLNESFLHYVILSKCHSDTINDYCGWKHYLSVLYRCKYIMLTSVPKWIINLMY